jgi:hypothetical protein
MDAIANTHPKQHANAHSHAHPDRHADTYCDTDAGASLVPPLARTPDRA